MGTRGVYGFRLDDKDYLSYNHYDSYPAGLGVQIATDCRRLVREFPDLKERVRQIGYSD